MGLDQYLYARKYVSSWTFDEQSRKEEYAKIMDALGLEQSDADADHPILSVNVPMASWRKANQIHRWFVDEVQDGNDDCQYYHASREKLIELITTCEEVLADHEKAEELLPVASGFFFGSYEYDEWYFSQLEDTIQMLKKTLDNPKFMQYDFYYRSSW